MPLKLMYITNSPEVALIAEKSGVDRIFLDLETLGKEERQKNYDSVKSQHSLSDISEIRKVLSKSELLVRVNPINVASKKEIDECIKRGADIVMLPMWKTVDEVKAFISYVNCRAKTMLLLETKEAESILDTILELDGIDEIHIGLNDLHLSYKLDFMFQLLANGTVESITKRIAKKGLTYGFGGIARIGFGALPAEYIIAEHYRLGSQMAILSRSFCDANKDPDLKNVDRKFNIGVQNIRNFEAALGEWSEHQFLENRKKVEICVDKIVSELKKS